MNRFGAEQFLRRLGKSKYNKDFIFKGGFLLAYRLESTRETKDLDFSVRKEDLEIFTNIFQEIVHIPFDDYLVWKTPKIQQLAVPDMPYPGIRLNCVFSLGKALGSIQIDIAAGDIVRAEKIYIQNIRYRDQPLVGEDFEVYAYPLENVFAEKLQIAITKGGTNSRMKDYYDLFLISKSPDLNDEKLIRIIKSTFKNRGLDSIREIDLSESEIQKIQLEWKRFIRKQNYSEIPDEISEVIEVINQRLRDSKARK